MEKLQEILQFGIWSFTLRLPSPSFFTLRPKCARPGTKTQPTSLPHLNASLTLAFCRQSSWIFLMPYMILLTGVDCPASAKKFLSCWLKGLSYCLIYSLTHEHCNDKQFVVLSDMQEPKSELYSPDTVCQTVWHLNKAVYPVGPLTLYFLWFVRQSDTFASLK